MLPWLYCISGAAIEMKFESFTRGIIRFGAGLFALLALIFSFWVLIDIVYGTYGHLLLSALTVILSSLLAYSLWKLKRWGRCMVILLSLAFVVNGIVNGLSTYGSLGKIPLVNFAFSIVIPIIYIILMMLPSTKKVMTN